MSCYQFSQNMTLVVSVLSLWGTVHNLECKDTGNKVCLTCFILAHKICFDNASVCETTVDSESKVAPLEPLTCCCPVKDMDVTEKDTGCCINLWLAPCIHSALIKDWFHSHYIVNILSYWQSWGPPFFPFVNALDTEPTTKLVAGSHRHFKTRTRQTDWQCCIGDLGIVQLWWDVMCCSAGTA